MVLSRVGFCLPGVIGQCLETFLVSQLGTVAIGTSWVKAKMLLNTLRCTGQPRSVSSAERNPGSHHDLEPCVSGQADPDSLGVAGEASSVFQKLSRRS